jgi:thiol-disulfide isomerase/thioredoxin
VRQKGSVRLVVTRRPAERLLLDSTRPSEPIQLLWLGGLPAHPRGSASVVLDREGNLLEVDSQLRARPLWAAIGEREILSVAPGPGGDLWLTDASGQLLRLGPDGQLRESLATGFSYPQVSSDARGNAWLVRSAARFAYRWDSAGAPLLIGIEAPSARQTPIGRAVVPAHVLLQDLANAGAAVAVADTLYYVPFIRDQVVAMTSTGDTLWVATRDLPQSTEEPRFEIADGHVVIDYHPVNLGAVIGPDGHLYVLSTAGVTTRLGRLDVFDRETGVLLRSALLPTALPTLAADRAGRVYLLDERTLLTGTNPGHREPLKPFRLAALGGGQVSLEALRGKVVLLNFWATWCAPCREELPALARLKQEIPDPDFVLLTVNEDVDTARVPEFLERLGLSVPVLLGRGRMRDEYHYPGLPHTVLLDREGSVVRRWSGYLDEPRLRVLRAALQAELRLGADTGHPHTALHPH